MGILVPRSFGGEGASVSELVEVCYGLGRSCGSTALIYAMHQTKVACVVRHAADSLWHQTLMRRIAAEQLLLASSTTEGEGGGNIRSSAAAVEREGAGIALERSATVISYGAHADAIVTTARRDADAAASDQVLVVFMKQDYTLDRVIEWDALGMRGTCSDGFTLRASGDCNQILPDPYDKIHAHTMVPVAHLAWSAAWAGVAADAVQRAQSLIRKAARKANGQLPPGAAHYTRAQSSLRLLRGLIAAAVDKFEQASGDIRALSSLDFQTAITLTKVDASELAVATVMSAFRACGLSGYRNDTEFSVGRHLRDVLSSPIMINNKRILANVEKTALMSSVPTRLRD